ncbi:uncharacterized protein LOC134445189 isoform X2 [Engraulis encrasicolus]|uniref:uncharacterized protein LOC134442490 isoform X2 n=1 Tax=Engraulis encrasicolus TaxID=184585 RepID=UPI002FD65D10
MAERLRTCELCSNKIGQLHMLPKDPQVKTEWLKFIFGAVPEKHSSKLSVCTLHFDENDYTNFGQFHSGFAAKLHLKPDAVPSSRLSGCRPTVPTCLGTPTFKDAACQTDPPSLSTKGTQLSAKTLRGYRVKSREIQTPCAAATETTWEALTSTPIKSRPAKRPRLAVEEDDDELLDEGEDSSLVAEPHDSTYVPDQDTMSDLESSHISDTSHSHTDVKYIVSEKCLLEIFEKCPLCKTKSDVTPHRRGTFLTVQQKCGRCGYYREWSSQPVTGTCPTTNLQLSAAIYFTGTSFFQLNKVFKALNLRSIGYTTFRRHARTYLEPAIIHKWHQFQEEQWKDLSQHKVKLGGDMRADSPGHSAKYGSYSLMNLSKRVLTDVQKLSSDYQTSTLEAFHSVLLRFTPKNVVFPFIGMLCRLYLAALHFNENARRCQAKTSSGRLKFKMSFPKAKKGAASVKPVKTAPTYNYIFELMELLFKEVVLNPQPFQDEMRAINVPSFLSAQYVHPTMDDAVAAYKSRFRVEA